MRQSDMQNLATLYSHIPEEHLASIMLKVYELEKLTGVKWYPDTEGVFDYQVEAMNQWERLAETKANEASANSLMF